MGTKQAAGQRHCHSHRPAVGAAPRARCRRPPTVQEAAGPVSVLAVGNVSPNDICSKHWTCTGTKIVSNVVAVIVDLAKSGPRYTRKPILYSANGTISGTYTSCMSINYSASSRTLVGYKIIYMKEECTLVCV